MTKQRVYQIAVILLPVLFAVGCDNPVEPIVVKTSYRVEQSSSNTANKPVDKPSSSSRIEYWCERPADKLDWENQKHHC